MLRMATSLSASQHDKFEYHTLGSLQICICCLLLGKKKTCFLYSLSLFCNCSLCITTQSSWKRLAQLHRKLNVIPSSGLKNRHLWEKHFTTTPFSLLLWSKSHYDIFAGYSENRMTEMTTQRGLLSLRMESYLEWCIPSGSAVWSQRGQWIDKGKGPVNFLTRYAINTRL